jgi:hypothetical protein
VFFAPTRLQAGGFWTAQLAQEIDDATAFILLVGERGLGSWQVPEYDEALDNPAGAGASRSRWPASNFGRTALWK